MALSRDEIVARSKRLYPDWPVNQYTGTLNDPFQEAQSRYADVGGGWSQFFGGLQKQQEDAQLAGKNFKVGWGGFGNEAADRTADAREAAIVPRGRAAAYTGTLNPLELNPLEQQTAKESSINQAVSDEVDQQKAIGQAQNETAKQIQQGDINELQTAYQNQVLDTQLAPPEVPSQVSVTQGQGGSPDTFAVRSAPLSARERLLSAIPGHLRLPVEQTLQAMDLRQRAADLAERAETGKEQAANPFGGAGAGAGGPQAGGLTGAEFLKTIPPALAKQVQAYAEGRLPFPSGFALKAPYFQQMLQAVGQYDPTFDAVNYNARNKAYADLTSPNGTGGKTINALNTAVSHIGQLSDLIEQLGNTNIPALNYVENKLGKATGSTKMTNFEAVQPQAMKEIERLWRGAGGSQGDIDALKSSLSPNMGIQQQREALANFADLMLGKLDATRQQRDNALGPVAAHRVPVLFDQNRPAFAKIFQRAGKALPDVLSGGNQPAQTPGSASAGPAGTVAMIDPNGQPLYVPQKDVERALKAGAKHAGGG